MGVVPWWVWSAAALSLAVILLDKLLIKEK